MLLLTPDNDLPVTCPACQTTYPASLALDQIRFWGPVTGVEALCPTCQTAFAQTLPSGQFNRFPVSVSLDERHTYLTERGRTIRPIFSFRLPRSKWLRFPSSIHEADRQAYVAERGGWLIPLVRTCLTSPAESTAEPVPISRQVRTLIAAKTAITLLICLDRCFGHALLMLFNAQRHHEQHPDRPIVAVVPRSLAWLVPDYVAETWIVDVPLSALAQPLSGFDASVHGQLARFGAVWFSTARIHFDHRTTRFADFTRTRKFDLNQFETVVPHLTFVLREDRLWLRHGPERWLHKVLNSLGLGPRTRPLWARWQAVRYCKLQAILYQKGILATVAAVGLTGGRQYPTDLGYAIHDDRHIFPVSAKQEHTWCAQYARSQLVVGVHGSGMLLPTSLAAGFVCLLPPDKRAHYAEDILMAHGNPIHQTLLGRFLPTSASPAQVADVLVSMLTEFPIWLAEERERASD